MYEKVRIDTARCDGCGNCLSHCPKAPAIFRIVKRRDSSVCEVQDASFCLGCTNCLTYCKNCAIELGKGG
ncbi:MAG: 2-oxoglutarate-acceptor oxidoreductase subunit OorD [Candidatus Syntrophoarchaeum sp. GoM_oil]|nr:MAG: 2-oxoglutarate-acceptor oxidoreductase subunit OorD [Candidatus Syntrophoarchaeum sp. GoM_oil]